MGDLLIMFVITGTKRPSPDYDDEDYDNDPFAPKKVIDPLLESVM